MFWQVERAKGRREVTRQKAVGTSAGLTVLIIAGSHRRVERMMKVRVAVRQAVSLADLQSKLVRDDLRMSW
jgi:hypothetical protein